ncbi:MAG: type II toxin-antitoxin system HipA family toxin [Acidobacteriota bacterium]|jgi:serine/threonine-protein kinase HipA|nr:type II toxin-antitoxin system HipA family toxin [Acidobacteriota bacterium]
MAFSHATVVEVLLGGVSVGAVSKPATSAFFAFEYQPSWIRNGFSISPLHLPLRPGAQSFPQLAPGTWHYLPAALADALPDRFGNSVIDAKMAQMGIPSNQITPLDRLTYVADRALGALEFRPPNDLADDPVELLDIVQLVKAARSAIAGTIATGRDAQAALQQLLSVGVSAGGARAKAIINLDPVTQEITAGQYARAGTEPWLLKFDGVGLDSQLGESQEYGRVEYAYSLMARAAGVEMPETRLLEENGRAHFMVRRFDRPPADEPGLPPRKLHAQSLCAMAHLDFNLLHVNDYSSLFATIKALGLGKNGEAGENSEDGEAAGVQAFVRMAFNFLASNCDDHAKNFSFLADASGTWRLAPAYDVTFAYNPDNIWLKEHLMGVDGKFADVTDKDLLAFADRHGIPYARQTLKRVRATLADWPEFAAEAGLSQQTIRQIAASIQAQGSGELT